MAREPDRDVHPSQLLSEAVDATRRTHLANERTLLAWWRTGLAALAVAIGVGRVVPELDNSVTRWPYVVAGIGFALWGIFAIAYGSARGAEVERALEEGKFGQSAAWPLRTLTVGAVALGLLTALVILFD
jgi:putative membrane protein